MQGHPLLIGGFIAVYVFCQIAIGVYLSRRIATDTDYFVAGRSLGVWMVTASLFATWFGAETVMSASAEIAANGLSGGRAEPFGYTICLIAMGLFIAVKFREGGYVTLADFFRKRFDRRAEMAAVLLTIPVSIIWAAAQLLAMSWLLQQALGVDQAITLLAATAVVICYTWFGGLMGDVATDIIQGAILSVGLIILLIATLAAAGGIGPAVASVTKDQLSLLGEGENWLARIDAYALPILGSLVTQEALSRLLAAKSPAIARRACFRAAWLYLLIGLIPVVLGLVGAHMVGGAKGDGYLPALADAIAHPAVALVLTGALLSAILSTVDSNILSVSALTTQNLLSRTHARLTPARQLAFARLITVAAGVLAFLVAASGQSIRELIVLTSVLGQAGLLVAVVIGLHWRFGDAHAAFAAIAASVGANIYSYILGPVATLIGEGATTSAAIGALLRAEAPIGDGVFLLSLAAGLAGYGAVALFRMRVSIA